MRRHRRTVLPNDALHQRPLEFFIIFTDIAEFTTDFRGSAMSDLC